MIHDQATELRALVKRANAGSPAPSNHLIVVAGGGSRSGVTTIATALATGLAEHGARVVLVDADLHLSAVASQLALRPPGTIVDVMRNQRDIHEILVPAERGIQVAAGGPIGTAETAGQGGERLIRQLLGMGRHADAVVADAGNHGSDLARQLLSRASHIVLVSTPENACLMEAYARLKRSRTEAETTPQLFVVVNRITAPRQAECVLQGLHQSTQRFLGLPLQLLGTIPAAAWPHGQKPDAPALSELGATLYARLEPLAVSRPHVLARANPAPPTPPAARGGLQKS